MKNVEPEKITARKHPADHDFMVVEWEFGVFRGGMTDAQFEIAPQSQSTHRRAKTVMCRHCMGTMKVDNDK